MVHCLQELSGDAKSSSRYDNLSVILTVISY